MAPLKTLLRSIDRRLFPPEDQYGRHLRRLIASDCPTVLDVGCGDDSRLLRLVPSIPYSLGVDARLPDPGSAARRHSEYRELDVRTLAEHFPPASFDCVVALDVIEHLEREDGLRLLGSMEAIAARRVVVFTPNGFLPQPPAPNNPYQEHISGWTTDDFERRGYTVVGINGWKRLRGPYASIRWRPRAFWARISRITQPLVVSKPRWAFQLLCFKDVALPSDSR